MKQVTNFKEKVLSGLILIYFIEIAVSIYLMVKYNNPYSAGVMTLVFMVLIFVVSLYEELTNWRIEK